MPFLLSSIAGISTLIGSLLIFNKKKSKDKIILSSLAFAAGVMLTVSIIDLIPESFIFLSNLYNNKLTILLILIFINIGFILSFSIDKYLPVNNKLYKVGIVSMIAIVLHNIPEGMITFITSSIDIKLGIGITLAIALHNIPEGITISIPIYYATGSKIKAIFYTFISGLSEVVGSIIAFLFFKNIMNEFLIGMLYSIIAGIMIYLSIFELLPKSFSYKNMKYTIIFFLIGSFIMYLSLILI